jgi:hypothetical protein
MWLYVQLVLIPYQKNQGPMRHSPRGNLSDLYPRWLGARELLLHHRDPYGADITREIQIGYYGRLLDPNRPGDPQDLQGFAYPVYVVLLLAPTVALPFAMVREAFFWLLAALTIGTIPLWLGTIQWRISKSALLIWILLILSCFPAIQALKLQQLTMLVAALIAAGMYAVFRHQFVVAGILFALATIKPQLVFLLIGWLCIWVIGDWRNRHRLLLSLLVSVAVLVGAGELLLPGWIAEFRTAMREYYRYTGGGLSVLDVALSPLWGRIAAACLAAMLLMFAWRNRHASEGTRTFQWTLCFALATTLLVIPMYAPYNQLLLVPGVMLAVRMRRKLWDKSRVNRFFLALSAFSVSWPFLAAVCLVIALVFLPGPTVQKAWGLPFYPIFAIPITIYALLLISRNAMSDETMQGAR